MRIMALQGKSPPRDQTPFYFITAQRILRLGIVTDGLAIHQSDDSLAIDADGNPFAVNGSVASHLLNRLDAKPATVEEKANRERNHKQRPNSDQPGIAA